MHKAPPSWVDTGYDRSKICECFASQAIVHYALASPIVTCKFKPGAEEGSGYCDPQITAK